MRSNSTVCWAWPAAMGPNLSNGGEFASTLPRKTSKVSALRLSLALYCVQGLGHVVEIERVSLGFLALRRGL